MGEARRRRKAFLAQHGVLPPAQAPQRFARVTVYLPVALRDWLQADLDTAEAQRKARGEPPAGLTLGDMVVSAVEAVVECVSASRADAEKPTSLIQVATHVPPGMAEAGARLRALRAGAR